MGVEGWSNRRVESDTGAPADGLGVFLGQLLTHWMLILEAIYLILVLFAPAVGRRRRSLSWDLPAAPDGPEMGLLEKALNR